MIRKELSFCIDAKFSGEPTDQKEDPFKGTSERSVSIGETVEDDEFSFGSNAMNVIEEDCDENDGAEWGFGPSDYGSVDGWDPSDPLFLRNYAQFLESRGQFFKAEEYYDRAIMTDPNNGEVLCLYAKLVWELYRDKEQALTYFERASLAAPGDSDILGAYASFLWEMDEQEEGHLSDTQVDDQNGVSWNDVTKDSKEQKRRISSPLHLAMGLGLNMPSISKVTDVNTESTETIGGEEHYRRMLEKNSCNPLFLKDHIEFLNQSQGDLQGDEKYYFGAIMENPRNGQIMSEYASLIWRLHGDKNRAGEYFKRAIQTNPQDSDVLASYAKFLWEIDDEEDSAEEA